MSAPIGPYRIAGERKPFLVRCRSWGVGYVLLRGLLASSMGVRVRLIHTPPSVGRAIPPERWLIAGHS